MKRRALAAVAVASLFSALAACDADEAVNSLDENAVDAGATKDAGSKEDAGAKEPPPYDAGTAKRTVFTRNPMGDVPNNYFGDGDFELSSSGDQEQYAWEAFQIMGGSAAQITTEIETGGLCRTGLRCAVMRANQAFFIRGAAASGKGNVVSIWAKVAPTSTCGVVRSVLVGCDTLTGAFGNLKSDATKPDAEGWCHYSQTIEPWPSALCLYVTNALASDETAIVDSALLGPDDGTVHAKKSEAYVPAADVMEGLDAIRSAVKPGPRPRKPRARTSLE